MKRSVSSKHLEGVSDLTLLAPIKRGFVPAFESVTYETRIQLLLKALFTIRQTAREHSMIKPFVDTAERIQSLLDFRLAVLDTEPRRLMLSATFDRPFEPYMRLIWDPLGPLLDVIFCNCDGYVTATGHGFEDYLAWVRRSQVDSDFFYAMSGHSVSDVQYLLKIERLQREREGGSGTAIRVEDPEEEAKQAREEKTELSNFLGMEALVALYRLTDFYPPDDPNGDGELLREAARQLLRGWPHEKLGPNDDWKKLIPDQLAWFEGRKSHEDAKHGETPEKPRSAEQDEAEWQAAKLARRSKSERLKRDPKAIQGGILEGYGCDSAPVRQGALLLMRVKSPELARAFPKAVDVTKGTVVESTDGMYVNLALTWRGLVALGVPEAELRRFPQEFREGMDERAGLLGDLRSSHPRRWRLPVRNWGGGGPAGGPSGTVDLSEVDLVVQLRTAHAGSDDPVGDTGHPLHEKIVELAGKAAEHGVELLAVQPMRRASNGHEQVGRDHFGFVDGLSQPRAVEGDPDRGKDEVALGELFWGYTNDRSDAPPAPSAILDNGTFLVVRKLRQNVGALRKFVADIVTRVTADGAKIDEEIVYGKLMGRTRDGVPMIGGHAWDNNRFTYASDPNGLRCPFQAHIRRTNPRGPREGRTLRPTPRILRRGMSYGTPLPEGKEDDRADRGIVFMAYAASIAEQYEVIQRWVNGANSTGIGSWLSDPIMGGAAGEDPRRFRFRYYWDEDFDPQTNPGVPAKRNYKTVRMEMKEPFVELQWGLYLFVPSIAAIEAIAGLSPVHAQEERARLELAEARRGEAIIAALRDQAEDGHEGRRAAAARWKALLEDFRAKDPGERADGPAVWAAIRVFHGGVIRAPYGDTEPGEDPPEVVLVASKDLVMRVFDNREKHYSMCGQMARMKQSFGPIFLGLDGGDDYCAKSVISKDILKIEMQTAFGAAYLAASSYLDVAFSHFKDMAFPEDKPFGVGVWGELDLRRDFITPVLGAICNQWFGIPDTLTASGDEPGPAQARARDACPVNHVDIGGWTWEAVRKPRCPGDFLATSRYCFYPDPVPRVQAYGQAQGKALRNAVRAHFQEVTSPQAPIAKLMNAHKVYNEDRDEFARTLIGVMTGFLPPTDATLRWTLYEWLEEKLFWRLQHDFRTAQVNAGKPTEQEFGAAAALMPGVLPSAYARAEAALLGPLKAAMQKRPSPDMLWRTSIRSHRLGDVEVGDGDRVFIGIVSAMAEDAIAGVSDVYPVFGGDRSADPHPLHACPAYKFAMGTMLGILGALLDRVSIEALPAPLLVRIRPAKASAPGPAPHGS